MGIRRFLTGFFEEQSSEPGLEIEDDGKLYLVLPGGTRREVTGGAGLPDEWTVGTGGQLAIVASDESAADLTVTSGFEPADESSVFVLKRSDGEAVFSVASTGQVEGYSTPDAEGLHLNRLDDAKANNYLKIANAVTTLFRIDKSGNPIIVGTHAAPADGDLAPGDCALWFDQTNGAARLMIKGKSANGTVVTGSVNLA